MDKDILMAAGHVVSMDVLLKGPTENRALLQPTQWEPGRLSRILPGFAAAARSTCTPFLIWQDIGGICARSIPAS